MSSTEEFMALLREYPETTVLTTGEDGFEDDDCPICQMMREQRGEGRVVTSHGVTTRVHEPNRAS